MVSQPRSTSTLTHVTALANQTGAQIAGGLIDLTPSAPNTATTDTATNIIAAIPGGVQANMTYNLTIRNLSGANAVTLVAGVGVTVSPAGSTDIGTNTTRSYYVRITGVGTPAVQLYALGKPTG